MMDRFGALRVGLCFTGILSVAVIGCGSSTTTSSSDLLKAGKSALEITGQAPGSLVVTVHVPKGETEPAILDGEPYTRLRLAGYESSKIAGAPELPVKIFHVIVPDGKSISFSVTGREKGETIHLGRDLAFTARLPVHTEKPVYVKKDLAAYQPVYGDQAVEILDVSYAGPTKIATVKISPVRYDPARRDILVRNDFDIHFAFTAAPSEQAPVARGFSIAPMLAVNSDARDQQVLTESTSVDLIIAHESHRDALARYLTFKREQGREVREHYITNLTTAQVKDIIKQEYAKANPPSHTLLVGNITQIPAWRGSSDNTWTDFSYTTLDAGEVPDVSLGRIPAHTAQELNAFIDKAMTRETETRNNDDVLLTAGNDVSLGCPANVTKVGDKIKVGSSAINIVKKYRSNGATTDQVIGAYNDSPNIVVYDGHGDRQGMQEIPLVINNLSRLSNGKHPIIFDIACLNANWSGGANARNFAETILLKSGTGAAGILASGGSGYGHDFFQTMGSLMAQARQELATGASPLNEVGQVILGAKIRHGSQDRTFWNYYGDPATTVWSE